MSVVDSDQESMNCSSSEVGKMWKLDPGEIFIWNLHCCRKKIKQHKESVLNLDDCINANYNYESLRSCFVSQSNSNNSCKNFVSYTQEDLVPIAFRDVNPEHKICKNDLKNISVLQNYVCITSKYVSILMDSNESASIIYNLFVRTNNCNKTSVNK